MTQSSFNVVIANEVKQSITTIPQDCHGLKSPRNDDSIQIERINTKMAKQEKIEKTAKILSIIALTMLIISSIYTIYNLRPENGFTIEKIFKKL